mgnify:FL=1
MTPPLRVGALFAGYGGLDLAVLDVFDAALEWYAEIDPAPARIMAHHHPGAPNLGDVTAVDWTNVPPVDVITGGSPCQDLSHAGKRAGMRAGTRSGLWASMLDAVDIIRPRLVVWENVRGALSAGAASGMESCPGCVGDTRHGRPPLRALGRVLGDLAGIGYDAAWTSLRAADVDGAHGRFRVFVVATPADADDTRRRQHGRPLTVPTEHAAAQHMRSGDHRPLTLLPTPRATDGTKGGPSQRGSSGDLMLPSAVHAQEWRQYAAAITRAEHATGRTAPPPTETGPKGKPRLSPAFVEWLMMLPAGHVTDPAIGLTRNEQLKALGNGVVPRQAAAAIRRALAMLDSDEPVRHTDETPAQPERPAP